MNALDNMRWFVLNINPEPWAIGPVGYARRGGKMSAYVGRNAQLDAYKEAVREEIGDGHDMIEGKVELAMFFWRNRAEYTTPQARQHRKHEADLTNMVKATEDALQGLLFKNDRDTNCIRAGVVEQGPDVVPRVVIGIRAGQEIPDLVNIIPTHVWEAIDQLQLELDFDSSNPDSSKPYPF